MGCVLLFLLVTLTGYCFLGNFSLVLLVIYFVILRVFCVFHCIFNVSCLERLTVGREKVGYMQIIIIYMQEEEGPHQPMDLPICLTMIKRLGNMVGLLTLWLRTQTLLCLDSSLFPFSLGQYCNGGDLADYLQGNGSFALDSLFMTGKLSAICRPMLLFCIVWLGEDCICRTANLLAQMG